MSFQKTLTATRKERTAHPCNTSHSSRGNHRRYGADEDAIIACLLHDTIEDTNVTYEDIAKKFGVTVADIVEGVTKLTRVVYTSKEEEQVENLRKMLMAMAKDIRVILIKISDRLHNLRTLNYQSQQSKWKKPWDQLKYTRP